MLTKLLIFGLLVVICFESYLLIGFMKNAHSWKILNNKLLKINDKLRATLKASNRLNGGAAHE